MKEIEISEKIEQLLIYAQQNLNLIDEDVVWSRNYLLDLLKVKAQAGCCKVRRLRLRWP